MGHNYIPKIKEATVPEEGSWIQLDNEWALVLCIPEWAEVVKSPAEGFRYVWMYDRVEKAYLFCFQLRDQVDRAIAFPSDHAGLLLQDQRAEKEFAMILTAREIGQGSYLFLKGISLKQHPGT